MPDFLPSDRTVPPVSWREAFARMPLETAPPGGWAIVARRIGARPRRRWRRWPLPLAAAAALLAALVPLWLPPRGAEQGAAPPLAATRADIPGGTAARAASDADAAAATGTLPQLQAESARLEALLQYARDGRVASGSAAVLAIELDDRVAAIDAALRRPGLDDPRRIALWRERVGLLRAYAGFESTRRWLAAGGERYDGALVAVD